MPGGAKEAAAKDAAQGGAGATIAAAGKDEGAKDEAKQLQLVVPTGPEGAAVGGATPEIEDTEAQGDDGAAEKKPPPLGRIARARQRLKTHREAVLGEDDQSKRPPMERDRAWEMSLSIKSFQNLTKNTIKFFFVVTIESDNPRHRSKVRTLPKYTNTFWADKGEIKTPFSPIVIFNKKEFKLSYKELERHHVKVDIWEISCWTFNTYLGYKTVKLSEVARRDPHVVMMLSRKLTRKQQQQQRQRGQVVGDVAQVSLNISFEEIFDFTLECDNWTLELNPDFPEHEQMRNNYSRLTFVMPKNKKSLPGQNQLPGSNLTETTPWIKTNEVGAFFWPSCGKYVFRGTRSHLISSYFMAFVHTTSTVLSDQVEQFRPQAVSGTGGRCLLNLISVLNISVFQGQVKNFKHFDHSNPGSYVIGNLCGNLKAVIRSKGLGFEETDLRMERPLQTVLVANVANLNRSEKHLVVKVKKCESLPGADIETGLSDPFLRVSWDGSSMTSTIMKQTIRPVFNQVFYFPVRIMKLTKRERKRDKEILKCELKSKNIVKIEVWDDDKQTNADYLGGCQVKLNELLNVRRKEKVNMLGRFKKPGRSEEDEDDNEDDAESRKGGEWFLEIKDARVYDGAKTPLTGGTFHANAQPVIHFEVFFYPDFEPDMKWDLEEKDEEDDIWPKVKEQWDKENEAFAVEFRSKFPDSVGAKPPLEALGLYDASALRRFPMEARNPLTMTEVPLMAFVCPIIVPEKLSYPAFVMHWIHCLTFDASTSQQRTGLLPSGGWKHTEFFLQRRKGAPQDHAVLLCCLLLGCKKDAFVCKGTWGDGYRTTEHVWVMTREEGWVTFWEPCTKQMYHMPNRYHHREKKKRGAKKAAKGQKKGAAGAGVVAEAGVLALAEEEEQEEDAEEEPERKKEVLQWEDEVEDARIRPDEMASLPTIGRMPKPKMRAEGKKIAKRGELERKEMVNRRMAENVAPSSQLLQPENLVDWLPYDSIEVVFNDQNLWANRQNCHPACITYDFEGSDNEEQQESGAQDGKQKERKPRYRKWRPLIQADQDEKMLKEMVASVVISPNVSVQPRLSGIIVEGIRRDLLIEMQQNMELHRSKKGVDTSFDNGVTPTPLTEQLEKFLTIHEEWSQIDPDFPPVRELLERKKPEREMMEETNVEDFILKILKPRQWNKKGSPFFHEMAYGDNRNYVQDQTARFRTLQAKIQSFQEKLPNFPTKRGKRFRGFPVHFNTSEVDSIREYLMSDETYTEMINNDEEDTSYTVECKIFPLLGGVLSVWLYIGVQETIRNDAFRPSGG